MACTNPTTLQMNLWMQTHPYRHKTFPVEYFGSGTHCQPGQTSLQLHCSPKCFIYIVPSFSLSFRDVRTALKAFPTVSSSLPFFLHRYFPNKNLTCCARLLFNIQRYQVIIPKICKCTLFGKRIFAVVISYGFGDEEIILDYRLFGP